ncbi:MAG TPA: hypothetical protein VED46_09465 [Alphaproteobacteria bacterium]|nr:hypothetical protein [Alphaproteobacteria bacterium]
MRNHHGPDQQRRLHSYSRLEPGLPYILANPGLPFFTDRMWISEAEIDRSEFHDWLQTSAGVAIG